MNLTGQLGASMGAAPQTLREWDRQWTDVGSFVCPECGSTEKPPLGSASGCIEVEDPSAVNPYVILRHWYTCVACRMRSPARLQALEPAEARRVWLAAWRPAWKEWESMIAKFIRATGK